MTQARVLVVDDDPHLREVVRYTLSRQGWEVLEAADGAAAVALARAESPDLIVMDVLMPELDGLEACRRVRTFSQVPVIFLSSRGEELDRVIGLEIGGDDYLAKPFSTRELVSRVKAVLRRTRPPEAPTAAEEVLTHGPLRLDTARHRCFVAGAEVELTATEFRLVAALLRQPGRVYSREELMERAYPDQRYVADRTMDSHLRNVRAKLRDAGCDPIETVHGVGFRLAGT
jgi:two-component system OmpR family response regulator